MEFLIAFLVFLGLIAGRILKSFAKEEIKPGKRYFKLFEKFILIILVFVFAYFNLNLFGFFGLIIGFIASSFFQVIYFYLGLGLFFSFFASKEYNLLTASLIFIYGLFYGTLKIDNIKKILFNFAIFSIPFLLFFIKDFILEYNSLFFGIVIGALINTIRKK